MRSKTKVVKALPHLYSDLIDKNKTTIYSYLYTPEVNSYFEELFVLKSHEIKFKSFVKKAISIGFENVLTLSSLYQISLKGDTVSIWPPGYKHPIKLEFFGDDLEKMYIFNEEIGRAAGNISSIILSNYTITEKTDFESIFINIGSGINPEEIIFTQSLNSIPKRDEFEMIDLHLQFPQLFYSRFDLLTKEIERLEANNYKILIKTKNKENLPEEFNKYLNKSYDSENEFINNLFSNLKEDFPPAGFISEKFKALFLTDRELFGSIYLSRPERNKTTSSNIKKLLTQFEGDIEIGNYVVHEDYGIAVYAGLKQEEIDGITQEYLLLKYDQEDELYVPIYQIEKITKYIGPDNYHPKLTRLGKAGWEIVRQKVKKSTEMLAKQLIEHYAKREVSNAKPIDKSMSNDYKQFLNEFKYIETYDQHRAINEVIDDLSKTRPMNRLLVGDVGFGKTEVFMRAAFKIVEAGGQVAILAPTTVLTAQHYAVFKERFHNFPFRIEYLSRFNTNAENKKYIDELNEGKIDIIIGTHRLLSSDVKFKNLQLLVVDEEQKFGVKQKEKIKQLNYGVHVLSVSATPIPRTLSIALSAIQDISIITQPPKNRKAIHTEILKDNWNKAIDAISFEISRGGQVYFIHNEVQTINAIKEKLTKLLPGIKFGIGHGQMTPDKLDKIMTDFYLKKFDVLICTTIVENGLDLPNVNTIIINRAHRFGLSQLYQLRGRVGRSETQSFCYLLYEGRDLKKSLEEDQEKDEKKVYRKYLERLQALVDNQELGAGFRIASRDLEIRGAGNILGDEQSGHISTVGYALYIELLAQEVERLKNTTQQKSVLHTII